jgi:hypothetical protein
MERLLAEAVVRDYAVLQERLVTAFLTHYLPKDRNRFLDVESGWFSVDGIRWEQFRHGVGVTFTSSLGEVNAAESMVEYPGGVTAGRICQYLESTKIESVEYLGKICPVEVGVMAELLDDMALRDVLICVRKNSPNTRLYVVRATPPAASGSLLKLEG